MSEAKNESTNNAKPHGNPDPKMPDSPDVKQEGWSAEQIAEQAANKDATEVKDEMKQGKQTQQKENR